MPHVLEFMEYGCCFITDMLQIGKVYAHKKFQSWSWMSNLHFLQMHLFMMYSVQEKQIHFVKSNILQIENVPSPSTNCK